MNRSDAYGIQKHDLIRALKSGLVAVMPTDTIYGIVCQAQSESAVNRVYEMRKRAPDKPCIILIGTIQDLSIFNVFLSEKQLEEINKHWPGPTSIILDCSDEKFAYLHRGTKSLAFRLPAPEGLRLLLGETGPLIAPSANPEGFAPASTIDEAKKYFGDMVDHYEDGGIVAGDPSRVVRLHADGTLTIIRK